MIWPSVVETVHTSSITVSDLESQVSQMEKTLSLGSLEPNLAREMINQVSKLLHSPPALLAPLAQRYDLANWPYSDNNASYMINYSQVFFSHYEFHNDLLSCYCVFFLLKLGKTKWECWIWTATYLYRVLKVVDGIGLQLNFSTKTISLTSPSLALAVIRVNSSNFNTTTFAAQDPTNLQVYPNLMRKQPFLVYDII